VVEKRFEVRPTEVEAEWDPRGLAETVKVELVGHKPVLARQILNGDWKVELVLTRYEEEDPEFEEMF